MTPTRKSSTSKAPVQPRQVQPTVRDELELQEEPVTETKPSVRIIARNLVALVLTFLLGFGGGYWQWGRDEYTEWKEQKELTELYEQVNPKDGYSLSVPYGDLGPQMIASGVIDYEEFAAVYENSNNPLTAEQMDILKKGSSDTIIITKENAHFLLNYFWAVGVANRNAILTEGPIVQYSDGQIERFASTGGWTLASKPVTDVYASLDLIPLNAGQQSLVEEVAAAVYRPCCNNPTLFPDCNHGMAMLGLLELMASRGATADEMFEAAKYVNAFWFPQQNLELAMYLKANQNTDFEEADARMIVGAEFSSGSGFALVHQNLQASGLLPQAPQQGGSCGA